MHQSLEENEVHRLLFRQAARMAPQDFNVRETKIYIQFDTLEINQNTQKETLKWEVKRACLSSTGVAMKLNNITVGA